MWAIIRVSLGLECFHYGLGFYSSHFASLNDSSLLCIEVKRNCSTAWLLCGPGVKQCWGLVDMCIFLSYNLQGGSDYCLIKKINSIGRVTSWVFS